MKILTQEAIALLKELISIPSFSSEEDQTAARIEQWFSDHDIPVNDNKIMSMLSMSNLMKTNPRFYSTPTTTRSNPIRPTPKTPSNHKWKTENSMDWAVTMPEALWFPSSLCLRIIMHTPTLATTSSSPLRQKKKVRARMA